MQQLTPLPRTNMAWRLALLAAGWAVAWGVHAQTAQPSAGQLLEENRRAAPPTLPSPTPQRLIDAPVRPTINMPEGVSVTVTQFKITGAVSYSAETLAELVQPWTGKRLDIRGLNDAAGALTRYYQANGHLLSYAYLPAQRVADGVIELSVLEGKLEGVQIVTAQDVRLRDQVVQVHTDPLVKPGALLQSEVERKLLLLNDIPGVTARAAFTPGATTGGAEVIISVAEEEPLEVRLDLNNHGAKSTGEYRAGINLQFRDLFGWGDNTTARGVASDRGSLVTGSLTTSVPVGGDGWRLGASVSRLKYQLAESFRTLGAVGQADSVGLDASYAMRRTADNSVYLRAGFDHKRLRDEVQQLGSSNAKRNDTAELAASFDHRSSWGGLSAGSATATMGQLRVSGAVRQPWRKLGVQLVHQQAVGQGLSLYGRVSAQTSGVGLDSSEKLGLTGPGAVRSYAAGEVSVDHGGLASVELRYARDFLGGNVVGSLFHDYAGGQINRGAPNLAGNDPEVTATGLGLGWASGGWGLNATLAWRGARLPTTGGNESGPRLFLQLSVTP